MDDFAPKPGCPMCSIVSTASRAPGQSPSPSDGRQPEILWTDENFTVYREAANPVSSKGHIIIVFNLHVLSLYMLSSSDLPLFVSARDLAHRFLSSRSPQEPSPGRPKNIFRVGFITSPFRDIKIPIADHLHAHAYILPADRMGWIRGVAFSPLAWYSIDDLIAEIREESSNNRVRSGTTLRPIDYVPQAGARTGTAAGVETTGPSIAVVDLESGQPITRNRDSTLVSG